MDDLESPTLAHRLAGTRAGESAPAPQAVERARRDLHRTVGGLVITFVALALAWRAIASDSETLIAICLVTAVFSSGIMDSTTLIKLTAIVFRRKEEP